MKLPISSSMQQKKKMLYSAATKYGTPAASAGEVFTYTVTNAVNVPALTNIRIQISNINNPVTPSGSLTVSITTRHPSNVVIDGPTPTSAYNMVQVGNAQIALGAVTTTKIATGAVTTGDIADGTVTTPKIADNSITSTKHAESFMKEGMLGDGILMDSIHFSSWVGKKLRVAQ
jgi:hypothetical protein